MAATYETGGTASLAVDSGAVNIGPEANHPKMRITGKGGLTIIVPYAPSDVSIDNVAAQWVETARAGRSPLVESAGRNLPKVTLEFICADPDGSPVGDVLDAMTKMAGDPTMWVMVDGMPALEQFAGVGQWRITACAIRTTQLQNGTNEPMMATVALSLTARSDASVSISPSANPYKPGYSKLVIDPDDVSKAEAQARLLPGPDGEIPDAQEVLDGINRKVAIEKMNGMIGSSVAISLQVGLFSASKGQPGQSTKVVNPGFVSGNIPANRGAWEKIARTLGRPKTDAAALCIEAGYTSAPQFLTAVAFGTKLSIRDGSGTKVTVEIA